MKRASSEIIITILLVGFAVTSALVVMNWMTKHAEETSDVVLGDIEEGLDCEKVNINILPSADCATADIINKGYFKIHRVISRTLEGNKLEVIPVVLNDNGEEVPCKSKSITVACSQEIPSSSNEPSYSEEIDLMPGEETDPPLQLCTPDCTGKYCGEDSCGNENGCGDCGSGFCINGFCNCYRLACSGGSCECSPGYSCDPLVELCLCKTGTCTSGCECFAPYEVCDQQSGNCFSRRGRCYYPDYPCPIGYYCEGSFESRPPYVLVFNRLSEEHDGYCLCEPGTCTTGQCVCPTGFRCNAGTCMI